MSAFETIIVGVDGRPGGRDALALANLLRERFGSRLIAVHACHASFFLNRNPESDYSAQVLTESQQLLDREIAESGVEAGAEVVPDDSPGNALHEAAERHGAQLIVVGSDSHSPLGRVLPGDVTTATLHGAPCAVAVAPRGYADTEPALATIGVGIDGSRESRAALALADQLARSVGARVSVMFAVSAASSIAAAYSPMAAVEIERAVREQAEQEVREALELLGDGAVGETPDGPAAEHLIELSSRVDLLVVGSRGYGPLRRLLLGSTSAKLFHDASCPVIAIPRSAAEDDDGDAG